MRANYWRQQQQSIGRTENPPETAMNTVHFVCFDCRKSFKQHGSSYSDRATEERPYPCPNRKRAMVKLGKYFKAPPQRATRQWLKVELLYRYGIRFNSSNMRTKEEWCTLASTVRSLSGNQSLEHVRKQLNQIRASRRATPA